MFGHLWIGTLLMGNAVCAQLRYRSEFYRNLTTSAAHLNRGNLKWPLLELERCRQLAAQGTPAPLAAAQAEVDRLHRQRAGAVATLRRLGYRARFESQDA